MKGIIVDSNQRTQFYLDQLQPLVGGRIVGTVRSGVDESGEEEFFGLTIQLASGQSKHLVLLADDEGNGPGSFNIVDGDDHG